MTHMNGAGGPSHRPIQRVFTKMKRFLGCEWIHGWRAPCACAIQSEGTVVGDIPEGLVKSDGGAVIAQSGRVRTTLQPEWNRGNTVSDGEGVFCFDRRGYSTGVPLWGIA